MVNTSVLIATNETDVAHELGERLLKLGYRIAGYATHNAEIIAKIDEVAPDLILADIQLSGKRDGINTEALVHSTFNKPIIYITGSLGQATVQRAKSIGPFGYIFKPFDDKQIYAMIETALLRHHLEGELREGRRWLHAVLNGINDGVIALDDQGEIRFINPIAQQLTGWSEIETLNKSLAEVFPLIDESSHEKVEILGAKSSWRPENAGTRMEGLLLSKYGQTTPVEADLTVIDDGSGSAAGMVLVFRDVTKRREAVQEIQRQSQRAEALVETAARLNAQLELTSVLDTVCTICNQALKASATVVYLEDTKPDGFSLRAANTPLTDLEKFKGMNFDIPGSMFKSILSEDKRVVIISDIQSHPDAPYLELFKGQNIHTMGMAGLYRQHDLMGVLISIYIGDPVPLPEDTPVLLQGLADQAAISINNASLFEQVRKGREQQKALTTRMVEIQETERRHIARELHDQIGQVLTGLQFMLESSKYQTGEAQLNNLSEAQETVSGLIEQIREMSLNLRPSMLDDIGLLPTLIWHFERFTKQTGIKVSFNHDGLTRRLSPNVETTVYRIVQEALTNVARHAQVTEAFVHLSLQENILGIEVIDHGIGFDTSFDISRASTAGLAGMRERANLLGGYLLVKSAPHRGTQIQAMVPLDSRPVERRNRVRNLGPG